MKSFVAVTLLIVLFALSIQAEKCTETKFVDNFDHKRFLGKWYGMKTTGIDAACGSYELFDTGNPRQYRMLFQPANVNVELTQGKTLAEGYTSKSGVALLNNSNLKVIYTDYDNYAVMAECKDLGGPVYFAITIGSRQKTLDNAIIEKLKAQISSDYGIDVSGMKVIDQTSCP